MASTTETGHAKIVANFDRLIESVSKMGKDYNPSNPVLLIEALQKASINCKNSMDAVGTATLGYKTAIKQREIAFEPISSLSTRVLNTLKASDKSGKSYEIARTYVRKIQGRRVSAKRTDDQLKADAEAGITYHEVSASQMSFDSRIENLGMLIKLAVGTAAYKPNEKDLQAESLNAMLEDLKRKNSAVITATTELFKARSRRNDLLYLEMTGITDIARDAKTYLKGAFGTRSPQYKEISGLMFRRLIRN